MAVDLTLEQYKSLSPEERTYFQKNGGEIVPEGGLPPSKWDRITRSEFEKLDPEDQSEFVLNGGTVVDEDEA